MGTTYVPVGLPIVSRNGFVVFELGSSLYQGEIGMSPAVLIQLEFRLEG